MKKRTTLIMLLLLLGSFAAWCQGIDVKSIEIIPEYPVITDSVKVRVEVLGTDYGHKIYDSLSISGDTIHIKYCVFLSPFAAGRVFTDTFELGTLAAGDYTVQVKAYKSLDTLNCNTPVGTASDTKSFNVTDNFSVKEEILNNGLSAHVMPNPAKNLQQLILKTEKAGNISIQICDLSGRVIMDVVSGNVLAGEHSFTADLTNLKSGMYVYRISYGDNILILKTLKK